MGFEPFDIATSATTIHGYRTGTGPPVLLLHGIPETHLMWRQVTPLLAEHFTVVATDLRGFGRSGVPAHSTASYSMRELARDQLEVMAALGYEQFAVVGHDRGARCAYRLTLDHPRAVTRLAVLDIIPTGEVFARADKDFALGFWVWSFLAAPFPVPERLIAGSPGTFVDHMLGEWADSDVFPPEVRAEYTAQFTDPERVRAICEQYRAAATVDCELDLAERGPITCPTLALWSATGALSAWYHPLEIWRAWCSDVRGRSVEAGHFLPEEAPGEVAQELITFLSGTPRPAAAASPTP